MAERLTPDFCVIGGGPAGVSLAMTLAAARRTVVLVERHRLGGQQTAAAVPSKALLAAARGPAVADFGAALAHMASAAAAVAVDWTPVRMAALGIRVIIGQAAFKDRATVTVGDGIEIAARRFIVATGSVPVVPAIPGLDGSPYFTEDTIFNLTERPDHLAVIGSGPHAVEIAQGSRRLGSAVTLLAPDAPLPDEDPEAVAIVLAQLRRDGVDIRTGVAIERVTIAPRSAVIAVRSETIAATHVVVSAGRKPATEGLALDKAGVFVDDTGIRVDRRHRTRNRRIYAVGDVVAGAERSVQTARRHAAVVLGEVLSRASADENAPPPARAMMTDPELAHVGLTEQDARGNRRRIEIVRGAFHDNDRAQIDGTPHGHIKIVTDRKGRILGATIVGARASELIGVWTLAIANGLDLAALRSQVTPYPTLSEAGAEAALGARPRHLTPSRLGRIIGALRVIR